MTEILNPSDIPVKGIDSKQIDQIVFAPRLNVPTHFEDCQSCEEVTRVWSDSTSVAQRSHQNPTMQRLSVECEELDPTNNTAIMNTKFSYAYSVMRGVETSEKVVSMEWTIYPGPTTETSPKKVECPALRAIAHRRKFEGK